MVEIIQAENGAFHRLDALAKEMGLVKTAAYFERQLEYQKDGGRVVLIAVKAGRDVGYCVLNWEPKYRPFKVMNIPEIQDLNVLSSERRQGIGRLMIAHCEGLAREKGCEQMGIGVGLTPDFGPGQRLYVKAGYVPDGQGVNYDRITVSHGEFRPVDDQLCLMMIKDLG